MNVLFAYVKSSGGLMKSHYDVYILFLLRRFNRFPREKQTRAYIFPAICWGRYLYIYEWRREEFANNTRFVYKPGTCFTGSAEWQR